MSGEHLSLAPTIEVSVPSKEANLLTAAEFDLDAFFDVEEVTAGQKAQTISSDAITTIAPQSVHSPESKKLQSPAVSAIKNTPPTSAPDLLVTLRNDADESITTIATKVTANSFAAGASLTSSVFSALKSLVGSCGIFCVHSLGSISKMPPLFSGGAGIGGLGGGLAGAGGFKMPNFRTDKHGNFHLDGNIDMLSRATGISKKDLLSGRFTAEDILVAFFSVFGDGIGIVFGLGIIESLVGGMFDSFMSDQGETSLAA